VFHDASGYACAALVVASLGAGARILTLEHAWRSRADVRICNRTIPPCYHPFDSVTSSQPRHHLKLALALHRTSTKNQLAGYSGPFRPDGRRNVEEQHSAELGSVRACGAWRASSKRRTCVVKISPAALKSTISGRGGSGFARCLTPIIRGQQTILCRSTPHSQ